MRHHVPFPWPQVPAHIPRFPWGWSCPPPNWVRLKGPQVCSDVQSYWGLGLHPGFGGKGHAWARDRTSRRPSASLSVKWASVLPPFYLLRVCLHLSNQDLYSRNAHGGSWTAARRPHAAARATPRLPCRHRVCVWGSMCAVPWPGGCGTHLGRPGSSGCSGCMAVACVLASGVGAEFTALHLHESEFPALSPIILFVSSVSVLKTALHMIQ